MDFVMKRYGNYREGKGSQVIPLRNAGKKFYMTHLTAVVAPSTSCTHICRKERSSALTKQLKEYTVL